MADKKAAAFRIASILAKVFLFFRKPLFLVLLWLRPLVLAMFNLLSFPCLLVSIAGWLTVGDMPQHQPIVWFIGAVSFAAFVGVWLYDAVLLRLAPDGFWLAD